MTDVDFRYLVESYGMTEENYEILECYYSKYNYLPIQFINFVLDKYIDKTKYKNVDGKEIEYNLAKQLFNALYGMSVTNNIRDEVIFDNELGWDEKSLTNEQITEALQNEKDKPFLSYAYGVWVTAYARNNLLKNVMKLDEYVAYCDTDSIKLLPGYDISIINNYNNFVKRKIKRVSEVLGIDINKFMPEDVNGEKHMLGVFEEDAHYEEFITQGAKKYAFTKYKKLNKIKKDDNVIKLDDEKALVLGITVAGVPKTGAKALKTLNDFKDDFVFKFEYTNKMMLFYCDNQLPIEITDYLGNTSLIDDKAGCCLVPTTYVLGKSIEYANLISENSSKQARYNEEV